MLFRSFLFIPFSWLGQHQKKNNPTPPTAEPEIKQPQTPRIQEPAQPEPSSFENFLDATGQYVIDTLPSVAGAVASEVCSSLVSAALQPQHHRSMAPEQTCFNHLNPEYNVPFIPNASRQDFSWITNPNSYRTSAQQSDPFTDTRSSLNQAQTTRQDYPENQSDGQPRKRKHSENNTTHQATSKRARVQTTQQNNTTNTTTTHSLEQEPGIILDDPLELSPLIYDHNPYAEFFEDAGDTAEERQLHNGLMDTIVTTTQLVHNNPNSLYAQTNSDFIFHITALAKAQENPEIGFLLAGCCDKVLEFTDNLINEKNTHSPINIDTDNCLFC